MKYRRIFFLSVLLAFSVVEGCSKNGLSSDDMLYIRTSVGLMKLKSTMPQNADSNYIQPKLDSVFKAFGMTPQSYEAYTGELVKNPDHTQLIYLAIKDSLGLR